MTGNATFPGTSEIGRRVRQLRRRQDLTLDALAKLSGVSRSILSQIEGGDANPTLATVWALAHTLQVDVSLLIDGASRAKSEPIEIASAAFTPEMRIEDGGCTLKILSPADHAETLEWYDLRFAPGGALISQAHARGMREHLTVIEGCLEIHASDGIAQVGTGATARYAADAPHAIHNRSDKPARALLVVTRQG